MNVRIDESWRAVLQPEFDKPYFEILTSYVRHAYATTTCYPPARLIFHAFDACPFDKVRVVILGQDPYHEPGQAEGWAFSVPDGVRIPPSLENIYKELQRDLGKPSPASGHLERWVEQGVLLLNATLTVEAHRAGSHQGKGWEELTDAAIMALNQQREHLVFMLWGNYAREKKHLITNPIHYILEAPHPSPYSAGKGFFGCNHFKKCNEFLIRNGMTPVNWSTIS